MYTLGALLLVFFAEYTFTGVFFPVYTCTLDFVSRYAGRTVIGILPRETPDTLTLHTITEEWDSQQHRSVFEGLESSACR